MKGFQYRGRLPASKSILNRLLVVQSYAAASSPSSGLRVIGDSDCDDVLRMKSALPALLRGDRPADCGAAGTTFRFLVLRASRIPGRHLVTGSARLLQRPQQALIDILEQFGVQATLGPNGMAITGDGWKRPANAVRVDRSQSSQFASAVLLNAWNLDFDLEMEQVGVAQGEEAPSEGYWEMTEEIVRAAGLELISTPKGLRIPAGSQIRAQELEAEIDISSAFAVAALGAVGGEVHLEDWPLRSLQPDVVFPDILRAMGVTVEQTSRLLTVRRTGALKPIEFNLRDCPDLFPVLSVLCALAPGRSRLFGAPHLAHKESSRIETSARLVEMMGRKAHPRSDGMEIDGASLSQGWGTSTVQVFDPTDDHRLAMAAAVARLAGAPIHIRHPEVVNKSFPGFFDLFTKGGGRLL